MSFEFTKKELKLLKSEQSDASIKALVERVAGTMDTRILAYRKLAIAAKVELDALESARALDAAYGKPVKRPVSASRAIQGTCRELRLGVRSAEAHIHPHSIPAPI